MQASNTNINCSYLNPPSVPEPQATDQSLPENTVARLDAVKKNISRYITQHRKIPLPLRTVLNLPSETCLSLLRKIPQGGTAPEKTEAINHIVDTMISLDLTDDQLQAIDRIIQRPPLVAKKLEDKDIHTSEFM